MADFVTIDRAEYNLLIRINHLAQEQAQTLDMVLDFIKENANTFDNETIFIGTIHSPEGLANIFRYRMPEEWQELETEVIDRETRNAKS